MKSGIEFVSRLNISKRQETARVRVRRKGAAAKRKATQQSRLGVKGVRRLKRTKRKLRESHLPPPFRGLPPTPPCVVPPEVSGAPVAGSTLAASSEPIAPSSEAPASGGIGEWRVLQVEGGWLRWSAVLGRVDSHCRGHTGCSKCSMNRQLRNGAVGLALLWLQRGGRQTSRYDHELLKETLSTSDAFAPRTAARVAFQERVRAEPEAQGLLDWEERLREGTRLEPTRLTCPSLHKTLLRLLGKPENST